MEDPRLAELWLHALQRLADRAAHELNNALNGVVVNLEVVRVRARPDADAGRLTPFAEAAVEQAEGATALSGALLALARAPRAGAPTDAAAVVRHVATLLAPAVAHRGVRVFVEETAPMPVAAPPFAVRAAIALALLHGAAVAEGRGGVAEPSSAVLPDELVGSNPANESLRRLRCTVSSDPRDVVRVEPSGAAGLPGEAAELLRDAGVDVSHDGDAITVVFRGAGTKST